MQSIIVAYAKEEDAKKIRSILVRRGIDVAAIATNGAQVLSLVTGMEGGVVICGYRLADVGFLDLAESLPEGFQMLLVTSPARVGDVELPENVIFLSTPLKVVDLLETLRMMITQFRRRRRQTRPPKRSEKDQKTLDQAKAILMERNHMSEPEAHRYLQKRAMDTGTNIVEMAEMVLMLAEN